MTAVSVLQLPVEQILRDNPIPALRQLRVEEDDQVIVISGSVSSYYLKQMAQEAIMPFRGSRNLHNRVNVVRN